MIAHIYSPGAQEPGVGVVIQSNRIGKVTIGTRTPLAVKSFKLYVTIPRQFYSHVSFEKIIIIGLNHCDTCIHVCTIFCSCTNTCLLSSFSWSLSPSLKVLPFHIFFLFLFLDSISKFIFSAERILLCDCLGLFCDAIIKHLRLGTYKMMKWIWAHGFREQKVQAEAAIPQENHREAHTTAGGTRLHVKEAKHVRRFHCIAATRKAVSPILWVLTKSFLETVTLILLLWMPDRDSLRTLYIEKQEGEMAEIRHV